MNADSAGIRYCFCTAALVFLRSVLYYDKKIKEKEGERMTSRVDSVGLSGISGYPVMVECSISSGLPHHAEPCPGRDEKDRHAL